MSRQLQKHTKPHNLNHIILCSFHWNQQNLRFQLTEIEKMCVTKRHQPTLEPQSLGFAVGPLLLGHAAYEKCLKNRWPPRASIPRHRIVTRRGQLFFQTIIGEIFLVGKIVSKDLLRAISFQTDLNGMKLKCVETPTG